MTDPVQAPTRTTNSASTPVHELARLAASHLAPQHSLRSMTERSAYVQEVVAELAWVTPDSQGPVHPRLANAGLRPCRERRA